MRKIVLLLTLVIPMVLGAQGMPPMQHHEDGFEKKDCVRGLEQLDLTDAQKDQLHEVQIDFRKKEIRLRADLELADIDLQELIADNVTGKKLDAAIDKVADLKSEMFKTRIARRLQVRKVLTDEQKAELKKLRRGRKPHMKEPKMGGKGDCDKDDDGKPKPDHRKRKNK